MKFGLHGNKSTLDSFTNVKKHIIHTIQEKNTDVGLEIAMALRDVMEYDFDWSSHA